MTPEALLGWKLRLFAAGAVLLVLGMVLGRTPLVLASIVVLAAGVLLRLVGRRRAARHSSWSGPPDEPPAER